MAVPDSRNAHQCAHVAVEEQRKPCHNVPKGTCVTHEFAGKLPEMIARIGEPGLLPAIDGMLREIAPIDLTCVFAYAPDRPPLFLHNGMQSVLKPGVLENYLRATYLLDCVYSACRAMTPPGLYRLKDLAPDAFFEGEYYNSPEVHPCISLETGSLTEEIVVLAPLAERAYAAYSLMRQNGSPAFTDAEFAALATAEPHVRALISRHYRDVAFAPGRVATADTNAPAEETFDLEPVFGTFMADRLTSRERAIVSLVLRGHSSLSIGQQLGIAEGTVKNHRKHIYAKLSISSQAELFAMFVRHAIARN